MDARPNRELSSVLVPRLFVELALRRGIDEAMIVAVHDYLIADEDTGFRLSGLNISPDGPAKMAAFLCDYVQHPHVGVPTWFAGCGGIPASLFQ